MALNAPTALSIAGRPNPLNERKRQVLSDVSTQIMDLANDPNPGTSPQSLQSAEEIGNAAVQAGVVPVSALPAMNQFLQSVKNQRQKQGVPGRLSTVKGSQVQAILDGPASLTPGRSVDLETIPGAQLDEQGRRRLDQFQVPAGTLQPGERVAGSIVSSQGDFAKALIEVVQPPGGGKPAKLTSSDVAKLIDLDLTVPEVKLLISMRQQERGVLPEAKGAAGFEKSLAQEVGERGLSGEAKTNFESMRRTQEETRKTQGKIVATREAKLNLPLGEDAVNFINPETLVAAEGKMSQRQALAAGFKTFRGNSSGQFLIFSVKALAVLDKMQDALPHLFPETPKGGKFQRGKNALSIFDKFLDGDVHAVSFFAALDANLAGFAKAAGDAANISIAEQGFQKKALPNSFDLRRTAQKKIDDKRELLRAVINMALGVAPMPQKFKDVLTPVNAPTPLPPGGAELP